MTDVKQDELMAHLTAFALAARPERIEDGMLALAPPEFRVAVGQTREMLATLGRAEPIVAPTAGVRGRLMKSLDARTSRRALLVIDMIVDHLAPGSLLEVPRARAVVSALKQRIDTARAQGIPVIYVVDEHEADDPDLDAWGTHAVKGSAGAEVWPELTPRIGDRVVKKSSYSAFHHSTLEAVLDELRIDTLTLTGCLTELGVMATATDAFQRGFVVEVPPDSQAGSTAALETTTLFIMGVMAPFGPARRERIEKLSDAA